MKPLSFPAGRSRPFPARSRASRTGTPIALLAAALMPLALWGCEPNGAAPAPDADPAPTAQASDDVKKEIAALKQEMKQLAAEMKGVKDSLRDMVSTYEVIEDLVKLTRRQVGENGNAIAGLRDHISMTVRSYATGTKDEGPLDVEDLEALVEKLKGMGVDLDPKAKTVTLKGIAATSVGPLEYAVVAEGGKAHESLFMMRCEPRALNAALLALGLTPGKAGRFEGGKPVSPTGPEVWVYARWTYEGKTVTHRIEDLVIDLRTQKPLERMAFVYHGSRHQRNSVTGQRFYAADITRDLIAVWNGPNTIIDNPRPEAAYDDSYVANSELMPPKGTPAEIVVRLSEAKDE